MSALGSLVPPAWRETLAAHLGSPSFAALERFLDAEERPIHPPRVQIFAALEHVAPADVKVVIVGQDPYPTAGNANGLAFSVAPGKKIPASLKNLFTALVAEGWPAPTSGDLTPWAKAGVLLLNTVLTVRDGQAGAHRKQGWEPLTDAILRTVADGPGPVVFLALGRPAQALAQSVDRARHHVIELPHPSPLNGRAFVVEAAKARPFTRANELLVAGGRTPVDWTLG